MFIDDLSGYVFLGLSAYSHAIISIVTWSFQALLFQKMKIPFRADLGNTYILLSWIGPVKMNIVFGATKYTVLLVSAFGCS